jgi:hypothetical protein
MVERQPSKLAVEGSIPFTRSKKLASATGCSEDPAPFFGRTKRHDLTGKVTAA